MICVLLLLVLLGVVVGIPFGTWLYFYENLGGGPVARGIRRENKAAQQAYLQSLSPADRKAYEHHEMRKRAYAAYGRYQRNGASDWDDVTKVPDFPDQNLEPENPLGFPKKWSPPRWRAAAKPDAVPPWRTTTRPRGPWPARPRRLPTRPTP